MNLKVTKNKLEVYHQDQRIATHKKMNDYQKYQWSTQPEHLPDQFHRPEWDGVRLIQWAESIGPSMHEVIKRVFDSVKIKEQGYRSALSILNLTKKHAKESVESACKLALTKVYSPRYKQLNTILSSGVLNQQKDTTKNKHDQASYGYVRGASYYGGDEQ